jgi:hypothetical protein
MFHSFFRSMAMSVSRAKTCFRFSVASIGVVAAVFAFCSADTAEAGRGRGRPRGPSPQQIQKMKEEMAYRQKEVARVQADVAAKEREIFQRFDENGDGRLIGPERSKYDKHMYEINSGKIPNPLADIVPLGKGPRTASSKN